MKEDIKKVERRRLMESREAEELKGEDETVYLAALELVSHHGIAMAVKAAIELNIFDILANAGPNAPLSAIEIACNIPNCDGTKAATRLDRLLCFLASHAIILCTPHLATGDRRFAFKPIYRLLATNQDGVSLAPAFLVKRSKVSMDSWQYLKDAVLEGINPFEKASGLMPSEYMAKNPEFGKLCNLYMASATKLTAEKIVDVYMGFEEVSQLVDVGGGIGAMLEIIISKYPQIKGINFDLPQVIANAPLISGVEHVAGDMLASIPNGEAILLKKILHNWSDKDCVRILKNCYKALPIIGKVIVVEQILPSIPDGNKVERYAYYMDLNMMVSFVEGKERRENEFRTLAIEAGFAEFKIACYAMTYHVMEFIKL